MKAKGFTLIELMIVVVVAAILAAIAIPSYSNFVRRSAQADTISTLHRFAQQTDRWRLKYKTYAGFFPTEYTSGTSYYLPTNNSSNHKYEVQIVNGSGAALSSASIGNAWTMYAFPKNTGLLKYADAMIYGSNNQGCSIDRSDGLPVSISELMIMNCNDAKATAW